MIKEIVKWTWLPITLGSPIIALALEYEKTAKVLFAIDLLLILSIYGASYPGFDKK